jgi:carbohydrate diacid regulator
LISIFTGLILDWSDMINKISKKLAQQIVDTVKDVSGYHINFIDGSGIIFASTNHQRIGDFHEIGYRAAMTGEVIETTGEQQFKGSLKGVNIPIFHNALFVAVIGITGEPDEVRKYANLAIRITQLLIREQEMDAAIFTQKEKVNYIVRSLITGDFSNRAYLNQCLNEVKVDATENMRTVVLLLNNRYNVVNISLIEQKLFRTLESIQAPLFSYTYPNEFIALVYEKNLPQTVSILKQLAAEYEHILSIGVGSSQEMNQLKLSYDNSYIAIKSLQVAKSNYAEFDLLDLEIILGSIDMKSREEYLKKTLSALSDEDINLLRTYYEQGMSLAKTCEILFLHKNTLQYKLDRIHRLSGYNPREFRHGVILYVALWLNVKLL